MAESVQSIRDRLGIGEQVPDSVLRQLASTKEGRAELNRIAAQPSGGGGGGLGGWLSDFGKGFVEPLKVAYGETLGRVPQGLRESAISALYPPAQGIALDVSAGQTAAKLAGAGKGAKKAAAKKGGGQSAADAAAAQRRAYEAQLQAVMNSPWTKMSNAVAQQYQQAQTPVLQAMSGSLTAPAQGQAVNQALSALGMPTGGAFGNWLNTEMAQSRATTAPVQQAMGAEAAQYAASTNPISSALEAYGQANALAVETAPEAAWLNALATHVTSNLSYGGTVPAADIPVFESAPGLSSALQQAGGYGASGAGPGQGLVSVSQLPTRPGERVQTTNTTGIPGLSIPGAPVATSGVSPGTTRPGG
jgi:hypothetical protein